jgi:hypothetical protein
MMGSNAELPNTIDMGSGSGPSPPGWVEKEVVSHPRLPEAIMEAFSILVGAEHLTR